MISLHGGKPRGHPLAEVIGWIGAICVLLAYGLATYGLLDANGFWYAFLNLVGAIGIIVIAAVKKVTQSVVLNTIWAIIALVAIVNVWLK